MRRFLVTGYDVFFFTQLVELSIAKSIDFLVPFQKFVHVITGRETFLVWMWWLAQHTRTSKTSGLGDDLYCEVR